MRLAAGLLLVCLGLVGCGEPAPIDALPPGAPLAINDTAIRYDLRFPCGDATCAGWLYAPKTDDKPPVVVMGHGLAGTRDAALPFFAETFARSGIAAFVFDYRHFGASGGAPRQLVDPWRQLDDWKAAVAFMRASEAVDGNRIALWGSSLGGGLALVAAARDGRVRAVVAQAPQIDSSVEGEATFPGAWWLTRLLLSAWGDLACSMFTDEPWLIPALAPSDGFGLVVDDAASAAVERGAARGSRYRNEVAARSIFTFDDYDPKTQAAALSAPVLLIASKQDRFAPYAAVEAFAKAHPNAVVQTIEGDHFDIYTAPQSEIAARTAAAFLAQNLGR
jgi:pimeloyl-ACP methyl ester carboxylesterase